MSVDLRVAVTCVTSDAVRRADLISLRRRVVSNVTVVDGTGKGLWPTVRRAWTGLSMGGGTHGIVLAEDMLPCVNFMAVASAAIERRPDVPVNFFSPRGKTLVFPARERGIHWGVGADATWGGSVALPLALVRDFLAWELKNVSPEYPHDDGRLAMWAIINKIDVWVTAPSLLEHVGAARSVMGHSSGIARNRVAAWYDEHPGTIDWSLGIEDPVRSPTMMGPVTRRELKRIRESNHAVDQR